MTLCLWGLLDSTADTRVHPHFSQTPDMSAWITGVFMVSPCLKTLCELRLDTLGQGPTPSLPGLWFVVIVLMWGKHSDLKTEDARDL